MKIGFFDSGLGGLVILKAAAKALPHYDYEFYGDTANLPYGDKTEAEVYELTKRGVEHLFARDCILVIIACNTASAETLRRLQDTFLVEEHPGRKILGVIIPTVEEVLAAEISRVLLIGTRRTIESGKYEREFKKLSTTVELTSIATPELVLLIEAGKIEEAYQQASATILGKGSVEGVILGCTHYSLLREKLAATPELAHVKIFSQDLLIPPKLATYLQNHPELEERLGREGTRNVFLTDPSPRYDGAIRELLGGAFIEG